VKKKVHVFNNYLEKLRLSSYAPAFRGPEGLTRNIRRFFEVGGKKGAVKKSGDKLESFKKRNETATPGRTRGFH